MSEIEVIEIFDVEEDPSQSSHSQSGTNILNLLTMNDSGGEDDQEIVCLDTVFRPAKPSSSSTSLLQNKDKIVKEVEVAPLKDLNLSEENDKLNSSSTIGGTSNYENQSFSSENSFALEEETIDDIMEPPPPPPSQKPGSSHLYSNNLYNTLHLSVNEPPFKKLKSSTQNDSTNLSASEPQCSPELATAQFEIDINKCPYGKPQPSFLALIVIILKNSKCLLSQEIWDYMSGLFPYYEHLLDPIQGDTKIRRTILKYQTHFLKTPTEVLKRGNRKLVMLNPVTKPEQQLLIDKVISQKERLGKSLYLPEILEDLIAGKLLLSSLKLYHLRPRKKVIRTTTKNKAGTSNPLQENIPTLSPENTMNDPLMCDISTSNANLIEEGLESLSPKSNSSTETVVFDPKIVNCRSLNNDETEGVNTVNNDKDETSSLETIERSSLVQDNFKNFTSDLLNPLEILQCPNNFSAENAFANTVWSNDDFSHNSQIVQIENSPENKNVNSFPEVEKCIPRWKEIFPWMLWKPWIKKMFCSTCQKLHNKVNSIERVIVFEVNHPDDVFKVSKLLRAHSEESSHKMAVILENKSIISILLFLLRAHFNEFTTVKEILAAFEDMVPDGQPISQDMLKVTLQMVGQYLEDRIIKNLILAKKFSIITDPCQGLLIVRWVNNENCPEEHVITSYYDVTDKSPLDYLSSLGVPVKNVIVSVMNSRCENCSRCRAIKKVQSRNSTPLRLPQLDRFLIFLWRTKLLKPFYSIGTTLCKLWLGFPHKFTEISKDLPLEKLSKFPSNPNTFLDIFQNFEKFKEIAKSIYSLTGSIEALGFQTVDISQYEWLIDIFPILTSINILLMEIKIVYPFHRDFDHLFHNVEKLKLFSEKAKKVLKEKKIKGLGIDATDIDDLYYLVDLTVKEYQQSIYHKGKALALAFNRMTVARNLERYMIDCNIQNSVMILYGSVKSNYKYEKTILIKYLLKFLKEHPSCEKLNSYQVLEYFQAHNLAESNNVVFSFHRLMGYFPFQRGKHERCLYDLKVYDYLFYRSAWCGIGCNIKKYLMTIILELNSRNTLSEQDMLTWWKSLSK